MKHFSLCDRTTKFNTSKKRLFHLWELKVNIEESCPNGFQLKAPQKEKIEFHFSNIVIKLLVNNSKPVQFFSFIQSEKFSLSIERPDWLIILQIWVQFTYWISSYHLPIEIPNSASLSLQMLLFVNVYLCAFWMMSMLEFFYMHTFDDSGRHTTIILGAALFLIAGPLEICRLYLGYSGNLRENARYSFVAIF